MSYKIGTVFALILVTIVFMGPTVDISIHKEPVELTQDLDQYLRQQESLYPDIVENTEKRIVWANKEKTKTDVAIVYLHGFSASRQEISPVSENIARVLGANLFQTRLTGHGRGSDAMSEASVSDWANDALEAMAIARQLGDTVIVIGTSTGGTLATWLALQSGDKQPDGLVLISPNFAPNNPNSSKLLWPWGLQLAELVLGKERSFKPRAPEQGLYWTTRYATSALLPMMGLVKLVNEADLQRVTTPTLSIYSPNDGTVDAKQSDITLQRFGSKIKEHMSVVDSVDKNQHVITGNIMSPNTNDKIAERILTFVRKLST